MQTKIDKGKLGEDIAARYLEEKGFIIVERNWRVARSEVDIIAQYGKKCIIVEVKYRVGDEYGHPEESVDEHKMEMLLAAAGAYWEQHPEYETIRLDVLSIVVDKKTTEMEIFHFEDAYF